jgi:hypothetical protein
MMISHPVTRPQLVLPIGLLLSISKAVANKEKGRGRGRERKYIRHVEGCALNISIRS